MSSAISGNTRPHLGSCWACSRARRAAFVQQFPQALGCHGNAFNPGLFRFPEKLSFLWRAPLPPDVPSLSLGPPQSPSGVIHSWQVPEVSGQPVDLNFQGLYLGPSTLGSFQNSPQSGGSASVPSVPLESAWRFPELFRHLKAQPSRGKA